MLGLSSALQVQKRVILALMLREIHTIYGESQLGYLWVLIQSAFGIAVFWAVREFVGASSPHGMPTAVFLILGFGVWNTISSAVTKSFSAVSANQTLLTFPQVTELDVQVSRVLVIFLTQLLSSFILLFAARVCGIEFGIEKPALLLALLVLVPLFGLGLGLLFSSLAVFIPALERIVPLVFRILFFASGVFFTVSAFTTELSKILMLNPILHLIELSRASLSVSYPTDGLSLAYAAWSLLVVLGLGLLLERYVRSRRGR